LLVTNTVNKSGVSISEEEGLSIERKRGDFGAKGRRGHEMGRESK